MNNDIQKIKCFLLDMDGTIYLDDKVFNGAISAVERMKKQGEVIFLTNNSSVSSQYYVKKLNRLGFKVTKDNIYTSTMATISYLKEYYLNSRIYLFSNDVVKEDLIDNGLNIVDEDPNIIVITFKTNYNYDDITKLCNLIRRGTPFICSHDDINCPTLDGYKPDVGSLLSLIEKATGKKPVAICGKPYSIMGKYIKSLLNLKKEEIAMVGDRLSTDIQFAINNNFVSVCVLSGETTLEDIEKFKYKNKITYIRKGIWEVL